MGLGHLKIPSHHDINVAQQHDKIGIAKTVNDTWPNNTYCIAQYLNDL